MTDKNSNSERLFAAGSAAAIGLLGAVVGVPLGGLICWGIATLWYGPPQKQSLDVIVLIFVQTIASLVGLVLSGVAGGFLGAGAGAYFASSSPNPNAVYPTEAASSKDEDK